MGRQLELGKGLPTFPKSSKITDSQYIQSQKIKLPLHDLSIVKATA
jgi:hypothetical protein